MNEELKTIFSNVNDWLFHIEAKCAALIALNVAIIAIVNDIVAKSFILFKSTVIILLCISTMIVLVAMLPIIRKLPLNRQEKTETDNSLFYTDISKYTKEEYRNLLEKQKICGKECTKIELNYIEEIVENSRIVMRKQSLFIKALRTTVASIFILILGIIVA